MPFTIIREDITRMKVDAIVNAANNSLLGGGGVDGAIHKAAGPQLVAECRTLNGCKTGEAKITKGYNLPAKFVIHTVGPIWQGGNHNEEKLLKSCYQSCLALAKNQNFQSIAFPLISTGAYGYPKDAALRIATGAISEFLLHNDMLVTLVVFSKEAITLSEKLFANIQKYIDDNYVDEEALNNRRQNFISERYEKGTDEVFFDEVQAEHSIQKPYALRTDRKLSDVLANLEETFSQSLLRLIDEKGKSDIETYKKACIDRKLFSKIKSKKYYKPSKSTAILFAIALELNLDETKDLLAKAGFAMTRSSKSDVIIEYFIEHGIYDVLEINEALYKFDQSPLVV